MDTEIINHKKDVLAAAERLIAAEQFRLFGMQGYSLNQFEVNMTTAISKGSIKQYLAD